MRKISFVTLLLVAVLVFSVGVAAQEFTLTILHTNDVHGRVFAFNDRGLGENTGGAARRATLVKQLKKENPHTLLLDAGDMFSGTPASSVFWGESDFMAALLIGYDAIAIGNHEFDFGHLELKSYIDHFPIPILGANTVYEDGTAFAPEFAIFEINGARVLVLGLVTPGTSVMTHPKNVTGLKFLDPAATALKVQEEQAGQYDIFVVLSHLGFKPDAALAEKVSGIDAIIGGHSHTVVDEPFYVGETIIAQSGDLGRYLGRVDLKIVENKVREATSSLIPITGGIEPNPVVERVLQELYGDRIEEQMARVVGYTSEDLLQPRQLKGEFRDSNLGNFVTDAMLWDTGADIAVYNNGGLRAYIAAGDITVGDLYAVEPFGNSVVTVELNKAQMEALFDRLAFLRGEQIAGGSYTVQNKKAYDILVSGQSLEDRIYIVAANDFMAAGGDNYHMLAAGKNHRYYDVVRDTFVRFLEANPDYEFKSQGRIIKK